MTDKRWTWITAPLGAMLAALLIVPAFLGDAIAGPLETSERYMAPGSLLRPITSRPIRG